MGIQVFADANVMFTTQEDLTDVVMETPSESSPARKIRELYFSGEQAQTSDREMYGTVESLYSSEVYLHVGNV